MRVAIAGAQMPDTIRELSNGLVTTHPDVGDLTPLYDRARVFVAPTRYSSGIPLKVLEAASRGVPVVCSSLLARQLDWVPGRDMLTADTPQGYAEAIHALSSSPDRWCTMRKAGLERIRLDCDPSRFRAIVAAAIHAITLPTRL
jgi:glycosyltransferase involved in cell wall biosynthesis